MTIGELLTELADSRPEAVALIDDAHNRTLTFRELEQEVAHAATWWKEQGVGRGQAVLVFVPMSADLYVALLALFRIGAVAMFLDPSAGAEHIERCCERWRPQAFFAIPKAHLLRLKSSALRRIPVKVTTHGWIPASRSWPKTWATVPLRESLAEPEDPALVTFTSGSTAAPKAAVRTHAFLLAQYKALAPSIALRAGEIDLATLPVFVLANLAAGLTTVIPDVDLRRPGSVDAAAIFRQIDERGVTRITASPAFFERLIEFGTANHQTLPTIEKIYTGGAPIFPRVLSALQDLAPNAHVVAVYGSTEAEPIAHIETDEISPTDLVAMKEGAGLLVGKPVREISLAILLDEWGKRRKPMDPESFTRRQLPCGETGEIVVSGSHVLAGYLGGIGDEETKFRVGNVIWHRTGDAGRMDSAGRLWLLGRCTARIDDAAGRLYPFSAETVAMTFPQVTRAAMVVEKSVRCLAVEGRIDSSTVGELKSALAWAGIERVIVLDSLPVDRRHNAKIDYPELRKLLQENE